MRTITTKSGKTLEIKWVLGPLSNGQIMIDLVGDVPIKKAAAEFDGVESYKVTDDTNGGTVYTMYDGYTQLVCVDRKIAKGVTRLTLEKGDNV